MDKPDKPLTGKCRVCGNEFLMEDLFLDNELGEVCVDHLPKKPKKKRKVSFKFKRKNWQLLTLIIIVTVTFLVIIFWDYLRLLITTDIKDIALNPDAYINKTWHINGVIGDFRGSTAIKDNKDYCIRTRNCFSLSDYGEFSIVGVVLDSEDGLFFNCTSPYHLIIGFNNRSSFERCECFIPSLGIDCDNLIIINPLSNIDFDRDNRIISASYEASVNDSCALLRSAKFQAYTLTSQGISNVFCEEVSSKLSDSFTCQVSQDYYGGLGAKIIFEYVCDVTKFSEVMTWAIN